MTKLSQALSDRGGFHDSRIVAVHWWARACVLEVEVDDLNANFLGLPEYEGEQPGALLMHGVSELDLALEKRDPGGGIFDIVVHSEEVGRLRLEIQVRPSGRMLVTCRDLLWRASELRPPPTART